MLELVTGPAAELATTAVAKSWLRVDDSTDDTLIDGLVVAARELAEAYTGRKFITQTWRLWLDYFPGSLGETLWFNGYREGAIAEVDGPVKYEIDLKLAPVSSITSVKYFDTSSSEATFSSSNYFLASDANSPGRLALNKNVTWPSTELRPAKAVQVDFVVGHGAASTAVPTSIITAVKMMLAHMYEHRGDDLASSPSITSEKIPVTALRLLEPYRIRRF